MAFKDALLQLSGYPEPTPAAAIKQAIDLAAALDTHLTALTFQIELPNPAMCLRTRCLTSLQWLPRNGRRA